jgi:hypothetical protein
MCPVLRRSWATANGVRTVRDCPSGTFEAGPCGGAKQRGIVAELLTWDSRGGNKPRGSTGGRPWFGVSNGMQLALAICGAICTG